MTRYGMRPVANHAQAVSALERAVTLEPSSAEYMFALFHIYHYTADYAGLSRLQRDGTIDTAIRRALMCTM